ncbi:MAG: DNA-binding response regulator [Bacteroidetes bacterium]|nr:MAG: DNA-binding response regulator [Bacteroidota bacterium]
MRLLLVEDNENLCQELSKKLSSAGFAVDCASNGVDGAFMGECEPYDLILLDWGLPDMSGIEVLKNWRKKQVQTPVLILTARGAWYEKVDGFRAGADDYLTKPFHFEELLVRIQALVRRAAGISRPRIGYGGLELDEQNQNAVMHRGAGQPDTIELTGIEFRILRYILLNPKKVSSAHQIFEHVYDFNDEKDSNVIEVYISRLRKKLGKDVICNRRGQGYYLNTDVLCESN